MENVPPAASSPQTDSFPAGLRVLVVDDDPTWLKILEKMLKRCCYEVTTCCLAREALNMLRERKDGFDIVISDVNMPDMDGFKLLEYVGLEMDLPVIMMSVDGETSRVMKGVQHGACDYLLKPVRMKELKNIWQHVLRKRIHEVKEIESYECIEDVQMRNRSNKFEDGYSPCGNGLSSRKKRNDSVNKEQDSQDNDPSCGKKSRVLWSVELHQKFVNAVDQIGLDKVGPKKILDLMNVPWLTRENVASHLQKYRLYLHRLQRHSESNTPFGIIKQFDFPSKDSPTCFSLQSSSTELQTRASSCTFGYSDSSIQVQDSLDIHGGGSIISVLPKEKPRNFLIDDLPDSKKRKSGSPNGQDHSFSSQKIDINYDAFGSSVHQRHSWSKEIPTVMLTQRVKQEHEPRERTHTLPSPEIDIQSDDLQFSSSNYTGTSFSGRNKVCASESKHLCTEYGNNYVKNVSPVAHITGCLSVQSEREMEDLQQFGPISTIGGSVSSMQNYGSDQKKASSLEFDPQYLLCGSESPFQSSNDAVQLFSFQGLGCVDNFGLTNVEYLDDYDLRLFTEIPSQSFDKVILNCQYLSDSMEYPIIDEALYVARPLSS